MTLIIGMKCSDGIVMGADSAFVSGTGSATIKRSHKQKICMVDERFLLSYSGEVDYGDRFAGVVEDIYESRLIDQSYIERNSKIKGDIAYRTAVEISGHVNDNFSGTRFDDNDDNDTEHRIRLMLTIPFSENDKFRYELIAFYGHHQPYVVTDDDFAIAFGSGYNIADPFLEFIRKYVLRDAVPDVEMGSRAVMMAMMLSVPMVAEGVDTPYQIAASYIRRGRPVSRIWTQRDVTRLERRVQKYLDKVHPLDV